MKPTTFTQLFKKNHLSETQQIDFLRFQRILFQVFADVSTIEEVFHLNDRETIDQRLQGFSIPFNCIDGVKRSSPAGSRQLDISRSINRSESMAQLQSSPEGMIKSFKMSPIEKQVLKHHLQIVKLQRQIKQNEKLKKLNIINKKRLKERLLSEQMQVL